LRRPRSGVFALFVALALLSGTFPRAASSQEPRDPLIDPPSGSAGSRFQIVGQSGWTPGEAVTLRVFFTTSTQPLDVARESAPLTQEFSVTVLADGTWSFPIVVNEFFAADGGARPPDTPGYIVVSAAAPSHTAVNAFVYTVRSVLPAGAQAIAGAGFGGAAAPAGLPLLVALFSAGVGALLLGSGMLRWRATWQDCANDRPANIPVTAIAPARSAMRHAARPRGTARPPTRPSR
jgi:hypothetical protein